MKNLLLILSVFTALYACTSDIENLDPIEIPFPVPTSIYHDYEIFYSDSGLTQVKITGRKLEQFKQTESSDAFDRMSDSVHLFFYNEKMIVTSELIADRAERNRKTGYMEAFGDVVVFNEKGEELNTEHLIWDEDQEKIISNTDVVIKKETQTIKGKGLISDQNFIDYEILYPTGTFDVENEDK